MAAVRARMPAQRVPSLFSSYLDKVYAAGRRGIVQLDGQNIFVYREAHDAPGDVDVEFGVGVTAPFAGSSEVEYTMVPSGPVAMTTHVGDYALLGAAHEAVIAWCREKGLSLAGPRWEVYGHWRENERPLTDVYYLLDQPAAR
jgi:effector-binding domain-containing protein